MLISQFVTNQIYSHDINLISFAPLPFLHNPVNLPLGIHRYFLYTYFFYQIKMLPRTVTSNSFLFMFNGRIWLIQMNFNLLYFLTNKVKKSLEVHILLIIPLISINIHKAFLWIHNFHKNALIYQFIKFLNRHPLTDPLLLFSFFIIPYSNIDYKNLC